MDECHLIQVGVDVISVHSSLLHHLVDECHLIQVGVDVISVHSSLLHHLVAKVHLDHAPFLIKFSDNCVLHVGSASGMLNPDEE